MESVGLVIPAYEPDVDVLHDYVVALLSLDEVDEVRVELDAPRDDRVRDALDDTAASLNVADRRRGKGAAITHGFDALDTDILAFADADASTPASSVADVLRAVDDGSDLAVGSRRHPAADVRDHQTILRRRLGDSFATIAGRFLNVDLYDYQCGMKALTGTAWRRLRCFLTEPGFAWDVEVIGFAGHLGLDVQEVPVSWEDRKNSTVDPLPTAYELGRALVRTWLRTGRTGAAVNPLCTMLGNSDRLVKQ